MPGIYVPRPVDEGDQRRLLHITTPRNWAAIQADARLEPNAHAHSTAQSCQPEALWAFALRSGHPADAIGFLRHQLAVGKLLVTPGDHRRDGEMIVLVIDRTACPDGWFVDKSYKCELLACGASEVLYESLDYWCRFEGVSTEVLSVLDLP